MNCIDYHLFTLLQEYMPFELEIMSLGSEDRQLLPTRA